MSSTISSQDRHDEFIKLEKSITEVRDMFFEVAQLVQDQGEMVSKFFFKRSIFEKVGFGVLASVLSNLTPSSLK